MPILPEFLPDLAYPTGFLRDHTRLARPYLIQFQFLPKFLQEPQPPANMPATSANASLLPALAAVFARAFRLRLR